MYLYRKSLSFKRRIDFKWIEKSRNDEDAYAANFSKNAYILDDTYKSNPESAKAAIDTLMELPANKHIAILSDMLDLGSEEKQLHYDVGVYAKEKGVDEIYCTGPLSKETAEGFNGKWYETKDEIYEACKPLLDKDCIIMIKGSRAMKMDTLVDAFRGKNNE